MKKNYLKKLLVKKVLKETLVHYFTKKLSKIKINPKVLLTENNNKAITHYQLDLIKLLKILIMNFTKNSISEKLLKA